MIKLRKLTITEILIGGLVSIIVTNLKSKKLKNPPTLDRVGKYKLISEINKDKRFRNFSIGIYSYGAKKYFIKTWTGRVKDTSYNLLLNEYFIGKVLYKKIKLHPSKWNIKTPKIIDYYRTEKSLSLVFEYIEGKNLSNYSVVKQILILSKVNQYLSEISQSLSEEDQKLLTKRSFLFYLLTLIFLTIPVALLSLKRSKAIFRSFIACIRAINSNYKLDLKLAHRDLNTDNLIVGKSGVYLIDCERMVLTLPDYDSTFLTLIPNKTNFKKELTKVFGESENEFLKQYMCLHFILNNNHLPNFKNHYLNFLDQ